MTELELFSTPERPPGWLVNPQVLRWETAHFDEVEVLKAIVVCPEHVSGEAALTEAVATAMVAGYSKPRDVLSSISGRRKTTVSVQSSGRYLRGNPERTFLTREGVNRLVLDSTKPEAARLKDWLAEDVLPAIEDTGRYAAPQPLADPLAELEREAALRDRAIAGWRAERQRAEGLLTAVKELAPSARLWDQLAANGVTLELGVAAKCLAKHRIEVGRNRLYDLLRSWGWVFQSSREPNQRAVETGYVAAELGKSYIDGRTGERKTGSPRTRVTTKGMERLAEHFGIALDPAEVERWAGSPDNSGATGLMGGAA